MKGVIFDMDGVLLDTHPAHLQAWRCLFTEAGKNVSESELKFVLDGHKRGEILCHFLGDLDDLQAAYYGSRKDEYFSRFSDSIRPLPGLVNFVDELGKANLPMAVATSAGKARCEALLTKFGLRRRFVAVVTGDDVCRGKPDPAIYWLAASRLGMCAEHLIVVEDAVSGVKAGRAAGMRCVGVGQNGRAASLLSAGAQVVIPDFREVRLGTLRNIFKSPQSTSTNN